LALAALGGSIYFELDPNRIIFQGNELQNDTSNEYSSGATSLNSSVEGID
jgi:hypothetical protein